MELHPTERSFSLDVIVPTFNRSQLLVQTLRSVMNADVPKGLKVEVYVVDNNSSDDTAERVNAFAGPLPLHYSREPRQGKSHALNTGLQGSSGDLVGFIDDDEEIDPGWFREVHRQFTRGGIEFLGGPYFPVWQSPPPAWLAHRYYGLVGSITEPTAECEFGPLFPGMLMGGNAVIARTVLARVGLYSTNPYIMHGGSHLCYGEDRDMYDRLIAFGARGRFSPELVIRHHIPSERLSMSYLRKRVYAHGVSQYLMRGKAAAKGPAIFGVPRWYFSRALFGVPHLVAGLFAGRSAASVEAQLNWFELAGQLAGLMRSVQNCAPQKHRLIRQSHG